MSFQAYIDSIREKTGKTPDDFRKLAAGKGFTKVGEAVAWLKTDFELGHGHANAMAQLLLNPDKFSAPAEDKFAALFSGKKAHWRQPCDAFAGQLKALGPDVELSPNSTYINVLRGKKKIGLIQVSTADRLDIGIKLKDTPATERLTEAGNWNAMVSHRVQVGEAKELDAELLGWFQAAYAG
ncbi:DUF4287 domain-containing protein [Chitinimonas naiadis]